MTELYRSHGLQWGIDYDQELYDPAVASLDEELARHLMDSGLYTFRATDLAIDLKENVNLIVIDLLQVSYSADPNTAQYFPLGDSQIDFFPSKRATFSIKDCRSYDPDNVLDIIARESLP